MSDLERLVAIEDIQQLQARRSRALDTKDWDLYRSCHAEDFQSFTLRTALGEYHNSDLDSMMAAVEEASVGLTCIHHVFAPEITFSSAEDATVIWRLEDRLYWEEDGEEHFFLGWGFYHDTVARRDGAWLFTSRSVKRLRVERSPGGSRYAGPQDWAIPRSPG